MRTDYSASGRQSPWQLALVWLRAALLTMCCGSTAHASSALSAVSLKKLSLEDLLNVEVELVSRREEPASGAAAAVHVITSEDIRRSGVRSLPEALRLAPNLQVAQTGSRGWAISARGFNASFSNKLLVLIDGRTVYSPLFSGVFWDMQDTLLEDVDRIEVISGPGATLWGANAVNGVINIVTQRAEDTQGLLLAAAVGTEERVLGAIRYGASIGEDVHYRAYAKYFNRDDSVLADEEDAADRWHSAQAGFRFDGEPDEESFWTVQGDLYGGRGEQFLAPDISHSGGNLLARWTRVLTQGRRLQIQTYYDHAYQLAREDFGDTLDTFDIDTQYEQEVGERHRVMIGAGYRYTHNEVKNLPGGIAFLPETLDRHLFSAFLQDEISLNERITVTIGSKFEHNDYTGLEIQPSVRTALSFESQVIWAAISRAVRTPSRIDRHLFFPAEPPFLFGGGPNVDTEEVVAYELGWRFRPRDDLFFSTAVFFNDYDDLRSLSPGPPFLIENNAEGEIYGLELEGTCQPTPAWRLTLGYTLLQEDLQVKPGRIDLNEGQGEAFDPQQQFQLRSSLDLLDNIQLDVWLRYVDRIENTARGFETIPDYLALDVRVGTLVMEHLEVSLVGQNLLEDEHPEFGARQIERAAYGKVTWRF